MNTPTHCVRKVFCKSGITKYLDNEKLLIFMTGIFNTGWINFDIEGVSEMLG
jgi:hypothetical protein